MLKQLVLLLSDSAAAACDMYPNASAGGNLLLLIQASCAQLPC